MKSGPVDSPAWATTCSPAARAAAKSATKSSGGPSASNPPRPRATTPSDSGNAGDPFHGLGDRDRADLGVADAVRNPAHLNAQIGEGLGLCPSFIPSS